MEDGDLAVHDSNSLCGLTVSSVLPLEKFVPLFFEHEQECASPPEAREVHLF